MQTKRVEWVDVLKGIAIIFVVLGHLPSNETVTRWIYAFHMPLFFLASGIFLASALSRSFKEFAGKRFRRLMIPYYFYGFLLYIPFFFATDLLTNHLKGQPSGYDLPGHLIGELFAIRSLDLGGMEIASHLWFLPCLFAASLIIYITLKITPPQYCR